MKQSWVSEADGLGFVGVFSCVGLSLGGAADWVGMTNLDDKKLLNFNTLIHDWASMEMGEWRSSKV
jgi:hypothetical protein